MEYAFFDNGFDINNPILPESDRINQYILKNSSDDIYKILNFLCSDEKFLYIHGFLGTGKRQIVNYITEFINNDVIKLEYYCKSATVCDDILLSFIDKIEKHDLAKAVNINVKISTLAVKFQQYITSIKKPFFIILHSFDDILPENVGLVQDVLINILNNSNVKLLISTKALINDIMKDVKYDKKVYVKAFTREIFNKFVETSGFTCNEKFMDDFYKFTRGYYYYTALSFKIMSAMNLKIPDFIEKIKLSGMNFDAYLGAAYINLIPQAIRNFFWFLRTVRHGISLNALAIWELYDEFSINYLKTNLMIFESDEILYVQDYFLQNIDISIPEKTQIKLHKYIINIYEKELKQPIQSRSVLISRQALRAEIDYHNNCINMLKSGKPKNEPEQLDNQNSDSQNNVQQEEKIPLTESLEAKLNDAKKFEESENYTKAIETYMGIMESENINSRMLNDIRHKLGLLYKSIADYSKSQHYYELVEKYYICNNENINLNYLYYELVQLYYLMYKTNSAIETAKKVIYSVDTPQSLMVDACILLGNIYLDIKNTKEASSYYEKALASVEDSTTKATLAELYFKYALLNDECGNLDIAFDYYTKCIGIGDSLYKSPAYSNLGLCYYENGNNSDALDCLMKAYEIEKSANNFDGICYSAMNIAKILNDENSDKALKYYLEAKQSAEFVNESSYIAEISVELGDYYYNQPENMKKALSEYFNAKKFAQDIPGFDISKIDQRISDMKLRIKEDDFNEIEKKYVK